MTQKILDCDIESCYKNIFIICNDTLISQNFDFGLQNIF